MSAVLYFPGVGAFPGCQVMKQTDGTYYWNFTHLWACVVAPMHKTKPSSYQRKLEAAMQAVHRDLYPEDQVDVAKFQSLWGTDDKAGAWVGDGMHTHCVMALFWWAFAGVREGRERTRLWENRLHAANAFRALVRRSLQTLPHAVTVYIKWGTEWRSCSLKQGMLDLHPDGRWRELPAWDALGQRWQHHEHQHGDGLGWVRGTPYYAHIADLLVGGTMLSSYTRHADVFAALAPLHAQLGNLVLHLLPRLLTADPSVLPRQAHQAIDKTLIATWLDRLLTDGAFKSLPDLLRALHVAGVGQLSGRIYKALHSMKSCPNCHLLCLRGSRFVAGAAGCSFVVRLFGCLPRGTKRCKET